MTCNPRYLPRTLKDIKRLDPAVRRPLLYSLKGCRSFRTNTYRIIYKVRRKELIVLVVAVGHRREVYEGLRKLLGK